MNNETLFVVSTLIILLVALLQFLLRRNPQTDQVKELEARLTEVEARLEAILAHLSGL